MCALALLLLELLQYNQLLVSGKKMNVTTKPDDSFPQRYKSLSEQARDKHASLFCL